MKKYDPKWGTKIQRLMFVAMLMRDAPRLQRSVKATANFGLHLALIIATVVAAGWALTL
tara:strand:- start:270 stop:446 length:177 start_codon:yes stop_codon:yes gene_type:complete